MVKPFCLYMFFFTDIKRTPAFSSTYVTLVWGGCNEEFFVVSDFLSLFFNNALPDREGKIRGSFFLWRTGQRKSLVCLCDSPFGSYDRRLESLFQWRRALPDIIPTKNLFL